MKEIYEISAGVEYHLKHLEDFTDALREVKHSLDEIRHAKEGQYQWEVALLRRELDDLKTQLKRYGLPEVKKYEREIKELKEMLDSDQWPKAVDPEALVNSEDQAFNRAEGILDLVIAERLDGHKFLDFGCGEGHVVAAAHKRGAIAVGYDVDPQHNFQEPLFTNDFEVVRANGPYNIILLHDVLDHIKVVDPITAMHQVRTVLQDGGRIYVRNHPWCSRHGGHLYKEINKAFIHLVFDEIELVRVGGYESEHNIKVTQPLETYRHWFKEAGLEIKSEIPIRQTVDGFFTRPSFVSQRLENLWKDSSEMQTDMEIEFVEYILEDSQGLSTTGLI